MKRVFIVVIGCALFGCEDSSEIKAIKDHLQTYDNSKLDLEVKIKSLEEDGFIIAKDSIAIIDSIIFRLALIEKAELESSIAKYNEEIKQNNEDLEIKRRYESPDVYRIYKNGNDKINKLNQGVIEAFQERIDKINSGLYYDLTSEIQEYYKIRSRFDSIPEMVLAVKYKCKYEFRNPLLNGIKQETINTFVLDTLRIKVLGRL